MGTQRRGTLSKNEFVGRQVCRMRRRIFQGVIATATVFLLCFPALQAKNVCRTGKLVGGLCVKRVDAAGLDPEVLNKVGTTRLSEVEKSIKWVNLLRFELTQTEVTVGQYEQCFRAGGCSKPGDFSGCNWKKNGRSNHPINCIDMKQAKKFCKWLEARLPTENEWEFAATSGGRNQKYPWGSKQASCEFAVYDDKLYRKTGRKVTKVKNPREGCGKRQTWPVCSKPAGNSAQGVCDLSGNVSEWTSSRFNTGSSRVVRGGSWDFDVFFLRVNKRYNLEPSYKEIYNGIRCSRSIKR